MGSKALRSLLIGAVTVVAIAAGAVWAVPATSAAGSGSGKATAKPGGGDCFRELAMGRGADLACEYPAWLADQEREDLRRLTRDMLLDARCTVSIRIARSMVVRALTEANHTFEAPAQPVRCELVTAGDKPLPITAVFAPRIVIKNGVAIEATPGLGKVEGVNSYLAWPVVAYINRSATVRNEMLRMINAYLTLRVARQG
jgi:hypothetical protein